MIMINNNLNFKYQVPQKGFTSVIIPVYKDLEGLTTTIDSLINQSINKNSYEIIVCNDGGDKSIEDYCLKNEITLIKIVPNRGSYYARNRGIEIAKGEFIAFVDADIKVPIDWLENGIKELEKSDYVAGNVKIDINKVKTLSNIYEYENAFNVEQYVEINHFGPTANLFVQANLFRKVGGFDEKLLSGGDVEFGNRVYLAGFNQYYSLNIDVIHPPRDYADLIKKIKRVTKGQKKLLDLYPDIFFYLKKNLFTIVKMVLPCRFGSFVMKYGKYGFCKMFGLYFFIWWIKIYSLISWFVDK